MSKKQPAMASDALLLAGAAAQELGVGVQTLHFYERVGLIPPPPRSRAGYRLYPAAILKRVRFIRKAQALGLPLNEIKTVLALADAGASPCGRVQASLADKVAEVNRRIEELSSFRDDLAALVDRAVQSKPNSRNVTVCPIVECAPVLQGAAMAAHAQTAPFWQSRQSHARCV